MSIVRQKVEIVYEACESIEKTGIIDEELNEIGMHLQEIVQLDFSRLILFLAASDGYIDIEERNYISSFMNTCMSVDNIIELINKTELYSMEFAQSVPLSVMLLVEVDNMTNRVKGFTSVETSKKLYELFVELGKEFLICDDDIDDREIENLSLFLNTIETYINENFVNYENQNEEISFDYNETLNDDVKVDNNENDETLEELLAGLNELTGLEEVKKDVNSLINLLQIQKIREERGMKKMPTSLHLVFSGNPGTGKTTVARLLAKIYCKLGVLSKGHLVEVDRSGLVGGYVGQTAIKVQEVLQNALGGILFIDEAYSLTVNKGESDYGIEAVDTLLKGMEDNRDDLVVIVAGYPELMNDFLNSNPGLRSRFNKFINFEDYKPEELLDIFTKMCIKSGYSLSEDCIEYVRKYFEKRYMTRNVNFANGRDVRNFFEMAIVNQANRLALDSNITNEELKELKLEDVQDIAI